MLKNKRRRVSNWAAFLLTWAGIGLAGHQLVVHPDTPLPDHWNPVKPLTISAPKTALTTWKLRRAKADPAACMAALYTSSDVVDLPDAVNSEQCHIRNRVQAQSLAGVKIRKTDTRCDVALTTAMWFEHGVKPLAEEILGQSVTGVRTQGSYNCRRIASTSRMSLHSQAKAIDIAGFTLADGSKIELQKHWQGNDARAEFLHRVRDTSCTWFKTTLGPEFNRAHADHFHLQIQGWGTCR